MSDLRQMEPGEDELNRVYWTTHMQFGSLSTFYSAMLKGLPTGTKLQISELESFGEELYKEGTIARFLTGRDKQDEYYQMLKSQKQAVLERLKDKSSKLLDAIAIVFAHGILDASVYGYLEVLSLASPDSFRIYIDKKQVILSDIESKSFNQLLMEKIVKFMEETIERSSLIYKLDKMHEITKPTNTQMNPEYKYDRERLVKFDDARHDIVHGNNWESYQIDFPSELFHWTLLNWYMLRIVAEKTGLKLSKELSEKYFLGE